MKSPLIFLFLILHPAAFAQTLLVSVEELEKHLPSAKTRLHWESSAFDPLRTEFSKPIEKLHMSSEDQTHINAIKSSLEARGLDGVVFGRGAMDSKILIDDHVFSTADEIGFVNALGEWSPVYPGRSVILLEIQKDKGVFLVSARSESHQENGTQFEWPWPEFFKF